MPKSDRRLLRFAALIRVSTEKQERKGESLRTQALQIEKAVASLGGKIVTRYAGQEHATAGWEREQRDKMLADAEKDRKPFDAVIVAHENRWSRDDTRSGADLERLQRAGIRFFVLNREQPLSDPTVRLYLGMSAVIGAYHARNQSKISIDNRIGRAKRGLPTCGKIPFGRTWDADKKTWAVDPTKQAMIADVAERYLAGESLPKLAKEYGVNHANLCKVLRERCGDQWTIKFDAPDLNIEEKVTLSIPRLLPEKTILAVRRRLEANRTYLHKPPVPKHDYPLSGRVFCAACGYCMFGQTNPSGHRYYRHCHGERVRACPLKNPMPWVRADKLETDVVRQLFLTFGNPAAIERAVKRAIPDCEKAMKQRKQVEAQLAKIVRARDRVLALIEKDLITDAEAEKKLHELKGRESALRIDLERLPAVLADLPDKKRLQIHVERDGKFIFVFDDDGNTRPGGNDIGTFLLMTDADRRNLIDAGLSGSGADGKPAGVYLTPAGGDRHAPKRFNYVVRGRLLERVEPRALP